MDISRRDFNRLSMAALSGAMAGASLAGCGGSDKPQPNAGGTTPPAAGGSPDAGATVAAADINACRGLNVCKGKGKGGQNECAGRGDCATTPAHTCATLNECKNLGGCSEKAGANDCKGMGGCEVPMHSGAWEAARAAFEKRMAAAGKTVGDAPAKKEN